MTHYEILGIRKTASTDEIKSAYKKLVKKYHPDVYPGDKTFAEKKIKEINEAYDILSDPDQKKEYDESINPTSSTSYTSQNYSGYSYTPPQNNHSTYGYSYKTSKRKSEAKSSKYSYENYRKTYNSTNYGSYDYQKRYTDYHRSKTPNSNYSKTEPNQAAVNKETIKDLTHLSKASIIVFVLIFYFIFLITNILEVANIFNSNDKNKETTSTTKEITEESSEKETEIFPDIDIDYDGVPKQTYEEYYNDKYNNNKFSEEPTEEEFDINSVYSNSELLEVYNEYFTEIYPTFNEFKQAVSDYYYQTYYQDYY